MTYPYPNNPFPVGSLVMYSNRCQTTTGGMLVEDENVNIFDVLIKVDGKWWTPKSFMTLDEWREKHGNLKEAVQS